MKLRSIPGKPRRKSLSLEVSYSSQEQLYSLEFFINQKVNGEKSKLLLEKIEFKDEEVFNIRYNSKMDEIAQGDEPDTLKNDT